MFVFINYSLYKFLFSCYILPDGSCVTAGFTGGCCNSSTTTCNGMTNSGSASCYCDHVCYLFGDCCSDVADIGCYLNTTGTSLIYPYSICPIVQSSYTNILLSICPIIHPIQLSILHIPISYYPFVQSSILFNCPFFVYQYPIIHLSILHIPVSFSNHIPLCVIM